MAEQDVEAFKAQILWRKARRRVRFKRFFVFSIMICTTSWVYWYKYMITADSGIPWPFLLTVFFIIVLIIQFFRAYILSNDQSVLKEYQKLKSEL